MLVFNHRTALTIAKHPTTINTVMHFRGSCEWLNAHPSFSLIFFNFWGVVRGGIMRALSCLLIMMGTNTPGKPVLLTWQRVQKDCILLYGGVNQVPDQQPGLTTKRWGHFLIWHLTVLKSENNTQPKNLENTFTTPLNEVMLNQMIEYYFCCVIWRNISKYFMAVTSNISSKNWNNMSELFCCPWYWSFLIICKIL